MDERQKFKPGGKQRKFERYLKKQITPVLKNLASSLLERDFVLGGAVRLDLFSLNGDNLILLNFDLIDGITSKNSELVEQAMSQVREQIKGTPTASGWSSNAREGFYQKDKLPEVLVVKSSRGFIVASARIDYECATCERNESCPECKCIQLGVECISCKDCKCPHCRIWTRELLCSFIREFVEEAWDDSILQASYKKVLNLSA